MRLTSPSGSSWTSFGLARCVIGLAFVLQSIQIQAFSFNTSTPTQCGQLTVQWDGGQEPFHIVLVPAFFQTAGRIRNITVPNGSNGRYSFELNEPAGLRFLATMYDGTGWGSGGTTGVLTVGSSGNSGCLDPVLNYDFTFAIDPQSAPGQCTNMQITWNDNVTYPVNLYGLIPSGTAFSVPIPQTRGQNTATWQANIREGTQFLLLMSNAGQYQTGGSTDLFTVGSGNAGCINDSSPRSYASGGGATGGSAGGDQNVDGVGGGSSGGTTGGGGGGGNGTGGGGGGGGGSSTPVGAIVGGTVGGVAFLVLLALLLFFCLRRRTRERRTSEDSGLKNYGVGSAEKRRRPVDLIGRRAGSANLENGVNRSDSLGNRTVEVRGEAYRPSPFRYPSPPELPTNASLATGGVAATGTTAAGLGSRLPPSSYPADAEKAPISPITAAAATAAPVSSGNRTSTGRPSEESQRTLTTSNGQAHSGGASAARRSSIQKHTVTPSTGSANTTTNPDRTSLAGQDLAITPEDRHSQEQHQADQADRDPMPNSTYREHEDAGPVIDLPPRYDQLRARNPDQDNA